MKRGWIYILLPLAILVTARAATFDFVIKTTQPEETFIFHTAGASGLNIDWGDGSLPTTGLSGTANRSHQYDLPGTYTNRIGGSADRIAFGNSGNTPKLLYDILTPLNSVTGIVSALNMFNGATSR